MAKIPVPNSQQVVQRGKAALNDASNGIMPSGPGVRAIADYVNMLNARRGRCYYSYTNKLLFTGFPGSAVDNFTHRFAFHTGPLATKLRFVGCIYKGSVNGLDPSDSFGYWVLRTGLTGAGTTTTQASMYASSVGAADIYAADNFADVRQDIDVLPDTDYRLEFHQINRFAIVSLSCYEVTRSLLDTTTDTNMIDTSAIRNLAPITDATTASILTASEKLWKRGGHPLFYFGVSDGGGFGLVSLTDKNIFNTAITAPATDTPGFPINVPYAGSRDGSTVGVVFWLHAWIAPSPNSATVKFLDQAGNTLATIAVPFTGTAGGDWYSTTANLTDASGATPTTRVEVYGSVTGGTLTWTAVGAFMYVA